jgi:predicted TPR repeat methyltransferase
LLRLPASSGDLSADRRLAFAEALAADGDPAAAAEVVASALEAAPGWAAGWFRLGELHEAAGQRDPAARAFAQAQRLDPADRLGATLRLALLAPGAQVLPMPPAFVETLYDSYADSFEASLVATLSYRGPEEIAALLPPDRRFAEALDLGCGTGLAGARLRDRCDRLEGWDLSQAMLRKASAKRVYDRLQRVDLAAPPAPVPTRDLVVAADVFIYLGPLEPIAAWVARSLVPGGLFAFTTEWHPGEGVVLGPERRFRHGSGYLRAVLEGAGFADVTLRDIVLRQDRGRPVQAQAVLARRP